ELARLLRSTVPLPRLLFGGLLAGTALAATAALIGVGLRHTQRYLASGGGRTLFLPVVAVSILLSPLWPAARSSALHLGLFATSVLPVLGAQARAAVSAA